MQSHKTDADRNAFFDVKDSKNENPFDKVEGYSGLVCPVLKIPFSSSQLQRRAIEVRETGNYYSQEFIVKWFYDQRNKKDPLTNKELKKVPSDNFQRDLTEGHVFRYSRDLSEAAEQSKLLIDAIEKYRPELHSHILRSIDDAKAHFQMSDNRSAGEEKEVKGNDHHVYQFEQDEGMCNKFFIMILGLLFALSFSHLNAVSRQLAYYRRDSSKQFANLSAHLDRALEENAHYRIKNEFCNESIKNTLLESLQVKEDEGFMRSDLLLKVFQQYPFLDDDKQFAVWNAISHCGTDSYFERTTRFDYNRPTLCLQELVRCNEGLKVINTQCSLSEVNERIESKTEYRDNSCIKEKNAIQKKIHKLQSKALSDKVMMSVSSCSDDLKKCRYNKFLVSQSCAVTTNKSGRLQMKSRAKFLYSQMRHCDRDLNRLKEKHHALKVHLRGNRKK